MTHANTPSANTQRRQLLLSLLAASFVPRIAWAAPDPKAREIILKNFHASKVLALGTETTMTLITERGQIRERRMETLQRLQPNGIDSKLVMKFSAPADIRGVGYLQIENSEADDDQWIYLPALKKSRRLVANNRKDSFMGSDFSYGDFSRPKVDTHEHRLLRQEPSDGRDCFVVESIPRDDSVRDDRGYSRKLTWVRPDSFLESRIDYFDLRNELLKSQIATDHQIVEAATGRWFVMHREMTNLQTQHKTILHIERAKAGVPTPDDAFTPQTIEKG